MTTAPSSPVVDPYSTPSSPVELPHSSWRSPPSHSTSSDSSSGGQQPGPSPPVHPSRPILKPATLPPTCSHREPERQHSSSATAPRSLIYFHSNPPSPGPAAIGSYRCYSKTAKGQRPCSLPNSTSSFSATPTLTDHLSNPSSRNSRQTPYWQKETPTTCNSSHHISRASSL